MPKFTPIKYGFLRGFRIIVDAVPIAASVVFNNGGGKFVALDANGRLTVAISTTAKLFGWANVGAFTASATAGVDVAEVDVSPLSVYRLPSTTQGAQSNLGAESDLSVTANVQSVVIGTSTNRNVKVVDLSTTATLVDVRMIEKYLTT